jgi:hypothetical protein
MARLIPESSWRESFLLADGRYDGGKFESLAFQLLEHLHGFGWRQTGGSHDGSRDFEKQDRRGLMWAECKAYSEKLSIYVISPTLVMALIEEPHTVIVISRSELNRNALRHLAAYQMASGKKIITYDGVVLDHAILMTGLYKEYFPDLPAPQHPEPQLEVRCSLTRDALMEPSEEDFAQRVAFTRSTRPIDVVRYGLLRLDFSVKNLSATSGSALKIEMLKETLDSSLRVISFQGHKHASSAALQIPPAGIVRTSLILQPCEARELLRLPKLKITGRGAPTRLIETGKVHVSHLYQIEVVGRSHRHTLEQAGRFLRNRRRGVVVALEGASGTGKSRLLHEVARAGLEEGFRCHFYDPEFEDAKGADHVIRSLIADLSEMPLVISETTESEEDALPSDSRSGSLLTRILYDPGFPIWDHIDSVAEGIVSLLKKRRTLLIIDNIQFTNDQFITLLEALLIHIQHLRDERVALVLSINTDFVRPESRVAALLTKLRAWGADASKSNTALHSRLNDFDTEDVAEFVQSVFSGKTGSGETASLYEKTLELLVRQVQPRPLNLWQSMMYLVDEGIASLEGDRLRISGDESLLSRLTYIPVRLEDLLALRWLRIHENEARGGVAQDELETAVRAAYLLGNDARERLLGLGATQRAIDRLLRAGIFTIRAGDRIQFFHSQVFNFFRTRYFNLDRDTAATLKRSFESLHLTKRKFQQYLILSHFSGDVSGAVLTATVRHMARDGLTIDYWREYTNILLRYLMNPRRALSVTSLKGVTLVSQWQQRLESLPRGATTLREFLTKQVLKNSRNSLPGRTLFDFYIATANACLSTYNDTEALEVIILALGDLEHSHFADAAEHNIALATVLNRKVATLKNFGRVEEALEVGREALKRFREVGHLSMVVETLFDLGSLLMGVSERRAEAWRLLEQGCEEFRLHKESMVDSAPYRYYYVSAELLLRDRRFTEAYNLCAEGARYAERVGIHFWGIRLVLLEVAARLLAGPHSEVEFETINRLLIKARDWANATQAERSRWALAYLDGKFLTQRGEYERAGKAFSEAVASLASRLRTPEQIAWRGSLLCNIAVSCRRYNLTLDEHSVAQLANNAVRAEIMEILAMSDSAFTRYEETYASQALFNYGDETIELP